jgi:hypothetical protein
MTSHRQIPTTLQSLKRETSWTSLSERPLAPGAPGSSGNTYRFDGRRLFWNVTPDQANLYVRLAAEELVLAPRIRSELKSIRLPSVS